MKKPVSFPMFRLFAAVLMAGTATAGTTAAQAETYRLKVTPSLTAQFKTTENGDLGTASDNQLHSYSVMPRVRVQADLKEDVQAVVDVRAVTTDGSTPGEDETGESVSTNDHIELRQYYLKFGGAPIGAERYTLQLGRQRIREDRSLWWNRDVEAARVSYDTTLLKGFVAVAQPLSSNKTSDDFHEASKDRLRVMAEGSLNYKPGQFVDVRALHEHDHSGTGHVGDTILADDADEEDNTLTWLGARAHGNLKAPHASVGNLGYRVDGIVVTGSEDLVTTTAAGLDEETITAVTDRDVFGWALDASTDITLNTAYNPTLTFGYAYGSGDDDTTGTDNAFRQSGLHGNSSLAGISSGSVYHYGEVLRPELSNIHILTAGAGVPVGTASDLSVFYHYYRLAEKATSLRSSGLRAGLNGTDKYLGQGVDVVFNTDLAQALELDSPSLDQVRFRASGGVFKAGEAYGTAKGENSARVFTELYLGY